MRSAKPSSLWLTSLGIVLSGVLAPAVAWSLQAAPPEVAPAVDKAAPVFENGEAQKVPAFSDRDEWIRHDLFVETTFDSDGDGKLDRMHVDVTRPRQTETEGLKVPVVYETSPYYCGIAGSMDYFWNPHQELGAEPPVRSAAPSIEPVSLRPTMSNTEVVDWVPRGFAVVHSASPGTGLSQGCPTVGGDNESLAPKAVIDWLCGRARGFTEAEGGEPVTADWCTGKVGMIGTSYNGTLPLAAATTGVEGLEAIIPVAPNTSYYHYYRSNGLVRHPGGYMGEDVDVLYDFINSGNLDRRPWCNGEIRDKEMKDGQDRDTGDYNDFWAGRDYMNDLGPMKAATLMAHAFNDWNVMPEHSVRIALALKEKGVPVQMFFHQGSHGGDPPMKMKNRWFTRYLYGVANGVENDPRAFIVRETGRRTQPTQYADYPHPDAQPVTLHLKAGGAAVGGLEAADLPDQGAESLVDDVEVPGAELAKAASSNHRLLYASQPLKQDLHISGAPRLSIKLAADKPAANLSVWLVALPWTDADKITDDVITRGWADPQNRHSLRESEPLVPGEFVEVEFDLQPDDQVIPAGTQIGLMIFSSDRDFTLWPEAGTKLTVDLDGTQLFLPVVGGQAAWDNATVHVE